MKRSKSLYKFSHEHHHGLVRAQRFKNIEKKSESAVPGIVDEFLSFWNSEILPHFDAEEKILLPALAKYTSNENPLIALTHEQHKELKEEIAKLESVWQSKTIDKELIQHVGELLYDHIRFEEKVLFAEIENVIPAEDLVTVVGDYKV